MRGRVLALAVVIVAAGVGVRVAGSAVDAAPSGVRVADVGGAPDAARPPAALPRITVRQLEPAASGGYARIEVADEGFSGPGTRTIDFGDGTPGLESESSAHGCGGADPLAQRHTEVVTHAYRYAGQWTVRVRFTPSCEGRPAPAYEGTGVVTVGPGAALSNGPALPLAGSATLDCGAATSEYGTPAPPPRTVACYPEYGDEDGYLTRVVYRWGDGSRDRVFTFPLSGCRDPEDHWPATYADDSHPVWGARHQYPKAGAYRATVTVTTAGCDGRDAQTRTASTRVTVA